MTEASTGGTAGRTAGRTTDRTLTWHRVLAWPLVLLVRAYQLVLSPMIPPSCRFYPSCSSYAVTALERYGPLKGSWLAVRRLLRCHPWNPGGVDHVPLRAPSARPLDQPDPSGTADQARDKDDRVRLLR